jgi:type IV secretory pathway VirB4 component
MYDDGICYLDNGKYSATWAFDDINYSNTEDSSRYAIFESYCKFLNSFDETTQFQIHINTKPISRSHINLDIKASDNASLEQKQCVTEYNELMRKRYLGDQTYIQQKYITVTVADDSYDAAQKRFELINSEKMELLQKMGSGNHMLDKIERLTLLREIYRPDDDTEITFSSMAKTGIIDKDLIAPYSMDTSHDDYIKLGDYYAQTLFLTDLPQDLSDKLIADITKINDKILLTINAAPQNPREAIKEINVRLKSLDREEEDSRSRQANMGINSPKPPRDLKKAIADTEKFLQDLQTRNEKMFLANILVLVRAKSLEGMDAIVNKIEDKVIKSGCSIKPFTFAQEESFDSVLPLGRNDTFVKRTLTTSSLAVFVPFNVVEIVHPGGLCYGRNHLSHNIIFMDRKRYINAHGFYFGASGSGKSTDAKLEVWECFFRTNDDIIIIDPEGEFTKLVNLLGGQVIEVSNSARTRFNPFEINEYYGGDDEPDPIPFKSDFIISLVEVTLNYRGGIDPVARSVIDRCVRLVYRDYKEHPCEENIPTFTDFFKILKEQAEPEAKYIASGLEIYVEGSLNIFASKSNVDINNRLISFNTKNLGKQLQVMGMTIIQDFCWNLISKNQALNKNTWLWNDEIHQSLKNESTANWLINSWKRGRKYGLIATGMTQEVRDAGKSEDGQALIANSEFIMLYRQKKSELDSITQLMGLSEEQTNKLQLCKPGEGLFKAGNNIVEFNNIFDKKLKLFQYIQSDVKEQKGEKNAG